MNRMERQHGGVEGPRYSPTGMLVIDKRLRMTSTQVCRIVKRRLMNAGAPKRVKVGHGGTLDPLATGVVVVLIGRATKLCDRIMAGEKEYLADVDLSRVSTTEDGEGEISEVPIEREPSLEEVERVCRTFTGVVMQRPPVFSALKIGGRPAYDMARRGQEVKLEARAVEIGEIRVVEYRWPLLRLDVRCGKGVYIRSLARDIGAALGVGGMLTGLRRTRVGRFGIDQAIDPDRIPEVLTQAELLPIEAWTGDKPEAIEGT